MTQHTITYDDAQRGLFVIASRLEAEAEEFEGPDGTMMAVDLTYWHPFAEVLESVRKTMGSAAPKPEAVIRTVPEKMYSNSPNIPKDFAGSIEATVGFVEGWNACRSTVLGSASASRTVPSDDEIQAEAELAVSNGECAAQVTMPEGEPRESMVRNVAARMRALLSRYVAPPAIRTMPSFSDIMAFSDKWSKEPGFCEFDRNDFVSCVREILERHDQPAASAEPVATLHDDGYYTFHGPKPEGYDRAGWRMPVFAAPAAAQAQPDDLKAILAAARHAGWAFERRADGITRMVPLVTGEAQAKPCAHVFEARPIDGSRSATAPCEAVCIKCGARGEDLTAPAQPVVEQSRSANIADEETAARKGFLNFLVPVGAGDWFYYWQGWRDRAALAQQPSTQDREDAAVLTSEFSKGYELGLRQRTSQDHEDAERYRWLRNESWAGYHIGKGKPQVAETIVFIEREHGNVKTVLAEEALDAAIDAARAAKGE